MLCNVIVCLLLAGAVYSASNKATQIIKLASSITYKAAAGNGFIKAVETNKFTSAQYNKIRIRVGSIATRKCPLRKRSIEEDTYPFTTLLTNQLSDDVTEDMSLLQQEVLSILETAEGTEIITSVMQESIIEPEAITKRGTTVYTWTYYIPSGKLGGRTKATVLLARVRNLMKNVTSLRFLSTALVNGTYRYALTNLCQCKTAATYAKFIAG